jgi:hypothetical protein
MFNDYLEQDHEKQDRIQAADLYVLLQREFRRRQVRECEICYVQLPFLIDRPTPEAANWEVIVPRECTLRCNEILEQVVDELSGQYDLVPGSR